MASLAQESWVRLGRHCNDHGIVEEANFGPGVLAGFPWPALETSGRDRYLQYREILWHRQESSA